jgi:hypothetical protein
MTDEELVKRLRSWAKDIQAGSTAIYAMDLDLKNAATSIEALTAERDALKQIAADHVLQELEQAARADKAEAKLAKAVEALRWQADQPEAHPFMAIAARATLAEIEGEKT